MDYINYINNKVVASTNDITYDGEPSEEHLRLMRSKPKFVTIDWQNILPEPPLNTSEVTKRELEIVEQMTANVTDEQRELVMLVDKDAASLYKKFLEEKGLEFPEDKYEQCLRQLDPVVLNLKYKYDRPRPFQLAGVYDKEINIIETGTHSTPAYPSGHTAQGGMCAGLLSALYPEYSSEFYAMVDEVGKARMLQGVHYPSDNDASMLISAAIWEDIKYDILPDLPTGNHTS